MSIVVVIPSRGRPARAKIAVNALRETAALVGTSIVLAVDQDDPYWGDYRKLEYSATFGPEVHMVTLAASETGSLVKATNTISMRIAAADPEAIIGNLGDDHLARSSGWDKAIAKALETPGIAYGDDQIQGEVLPTAPFISARIVAALGYYFLPDLEHMYVDNVVRDIAEQAGVRRYLPDVIIEHVHPAVGKVDWDEGYVRVNAEAAIRRDKLRYESWRINAMAVDIGRVQAELAR